ncbi:MAG: zinc ribbon domain-containing protein [Bryobacterales bacterium]|nr:zinc ribbon domain-containing protein [Bryobacterales bacterium]
MAKCLQCGGRLARIHRTFRDRLRFAAIYRCRDCGARQEQEHWYSAFFGPASRCPSCGTYRLQRLREVDRIDRVSRNPISFIQRILGGQLHRCGYCRLQFYDLRPIAPSPKVAAPQAPGSETPPGPL